MTEVWGANRQSVVDLAFALSGEKIPEDYRYLLWNALQPMLPWLEEEAGAGIVGIGVVRTGTDDALLSRRARLTLRVPYHRVDAARSLEGVRIHVGAYEVEIGAARERPLQASPTLYAPLVALGEDDELHFTQALMERLTAMGASCRPILGRHRRLRLAMDTIDAYPVALQGCNPSQSLLIQVLGVGNRRKIGCGVFIPHKKIEHFE